MRQVLLRIPVPLTDHAITIYGYGAMLCLGFLAAIWVAARRAWSLGLSVDVVYNAALLAFAGGILGARVFFVVQYSGQFPGLWDLVRIWEGGLTYYGGLALAAVAVVGYLLAARQPVLAWLDVFAPSLALGLAFGRIGCFLNGCCYGDVAHGVAGMVWPAGSIPWQHYAEEHLAAHGLALAPGASADAGAVLGGLAATWRPPAIHATQLYSLVNALLLFAVLQVGFARRRRHGQVFFGFLLLYAVSRLLLEFLRADEAEAYLLGLPTLLTAVGWAGAAARLPGLTVSQNVALAMGAGAAAGLGVLARRRPDLPAGAAPASAPLGGARGPAAPPRRGRRKEKKS